MILEIGILVGAVLILANSRQGRPIAFKDTDIVYLEGHNNISVPVLGKTARAFIELQKAALSEGFDIRPTSGFRTREKQTELWNEALAKYKDEKTARRYVARPGYSRHEKGAAIDLWLEMAGTPDNAKAIKKTRTFQWLERNANRFGFVWYNRDVEPWHIELYKS